MLNLPHNSFAIAALVIATTSPALADHKVLLTGAAANELLLRYNQVVAQLPSTGTTLNPSTTIRETASDYSITFIGLPADTKRATFTSRS